MDRIIAAVKGKSNPAPAKASPTIKIYDIYGNVLREVAGSSLNYANLYGANLYGANLRGANLYGANLRGANLYGAIIEGTQPAEIENSYTDLATGTMLGYFWMAWRDKAAGIVLRYGCETRPIADWCEKVGELCVKHEPHRAELFEGALRGLIEMLLQGGVRAYEEESSEAVAAD